MTNLLVSVCTLSALLFCRGLVFCPNQIEVIQLQFDYLRPQVPARRTGSGLQLLLDLGHLLQDQLSHHRRVWRRHHLIPKLYMPTLHLLKVSTLVIIRNGSYLLPSKSFVLTSGSAVTPNFLKRKSPSLTQLLDNIC